ncbi:TAXI family TRAP transporter solute-binding subunit [Nocardiopsis baichengensis]|uniref:TAXI family TRAP transporter solute-binding subunit n=1 Tax=Nocardiopsis baichengensis TaxID=280240 RepID=UPI000A024F1A|nr:TAXI family TRAP transporter solute-binding subunit [Nocardiopsis baichengensis]
MTTRFTARRFAAVSAVAAAGVIAVAGCGGGGSVPGAGGDDAEVTGGDLTLGTGSTGGTYYPLGGEIAQIWSDNIEDVNVSTQATGASVENMRLLDGGELDVAMAINGVAADAVDSEGDFADEPIENGDDVFMIGNVYPEVLQIVASEDSGIETVEDLEGKRVDVGPPGSGTELAANAVLEAYGMSTDDIEPFNSTFEEAASKLGDGQTDAAFAILAVPAGSIEQVATTNDVRLVEFSGDGLETLQENSPSYSTMEIPADTYNGQDEAVTTVTNWATLFVRGSMGEDLAYNLTKEMYDRAGDIGHDVGSQVQLDTALEGQGAVDLHPGAERFYQEEGVLD